MVKVKATMAKTPVPASAAAAASAGGSNAAPANRTGTGTGGSVVEPPSREELLTRKKDIQTRLKELSVKKNAQPILVVETEDAIAPSSNTATNTTTNAAAIIAELPSPSDPKIPMLPPCLKTDTHWDFTLKEMAWLSADFRSERKRQISQAKKLSNAILQHFGTLATKRARERALMEARVRRLGGRLARSVQRGYWKKMERVVEYKQRLEGEAAKRREMDRRLVFLVRQTERYGERLRSDSVVEGGAGGRRGQRSDSQGGHGGAAEGAGSRVEEGIGGVVGRKMTIEEALSNSPGRRRAKSAARVDYSKMDQDSNYDESSFYGESMETSTTTLTGRGAGGGASSNADGAAVVSVGGGGVKEANDGRCYEPTEREIANANRDERKEYAALLESFDRQPAEEVQEEVHKLLQERDMDLDDVIRRLIDEGGGRAEEEETGKEEGKKPLIEVIDEKLSVVKEEGDDEGKRTGKRRRVCFAPSHEEKTFEPSIRVSDSTKAIKGIVMERANAKIRHENNGPLTSKKTDRHEELDEFHFDASLEDLFDDETAMEAEEEMLVGGDEIDSLRTMEGVETTRASSAGTETDNDVVENQNRTASVASSLLLDDNDDDREEKDEPFRLEQEEADDETTIAAEERLGRDMSYREEIDLLRMESEVSVEELRAMYAGMEKGRVDDDDDNNNDGNDASNENSKGSGRAKDDGGAAMDPAMLLLDEDDHEDEDEFHVAGDELDDETTIDAEERLGRDMSYKEEIDLLQHENEMSIEELRAMYAGMDEANEGPAVAAAAGGDEDDNESKNDSAGAAAKLPSVASLLLDEDDQEEKDEFHLEKEELDDETTIEAEEKLGRDMSYREELDLLQRESEMSVEELRAMYSATDDTAKESGVGDSGPAAPDGAEGGMELLSDVNESSKRKQPPSGKLSNVDEDEHDGRKKTKTDDAANDEGMSAIASLAASDTKARENMLTRPFLLASWVKLRAYQHIGLNWLVSIQSRRLNGILADEMGLGKTLQTISMVAYLASYKGIWGPHLIIVPTSCLVNWEVEFKRFCPGLKVLCYYGNAKRRKELRTGWTKSNVQHVVITSYQLAVQDAFAFKRKKWYYLILDEAHNIKNFESQRWQTLIGFNTQRRLLLTGTPLQNNLMELWSLLHFLMPHVFTDRKQFSYWFSNPMDNIIEGNSKRNDDLIGRLHGIIRPFVLRRLKKDVETQLPGKYEHIVKCQLSRRQMFLYEEFMARSSTRKTLQSGGNFMGMMSVLMQLRKVCNHPDLFEPRCVTTPFVMEPLSMSTAACVVNAIDSKSALERVSPFLRLPLWTMGRGTPSFEHSISVDSVLAGQLTKLKPPKSSIVQNDDDLSEPMPHLDDIDNQGLFSFLSRIRTEEKDDRASQAQFISGVNTQRCESMAFPYSDRMQQTVTVGRPGLCDLPVRDELTACQIAETPIELLAMRKSQEERANDLDEIAEKFVFCVPKASTHKIVLSSSSNDSASSTLERTFMEKSSKSFDKYYSPFKKAESRLTMCFPDKKLVQFDAGKLQTLATLLRELKIGGHRVLIFTQMSKMLDVLEAFLNLNGHTYLRLDGSVGVERRQRLMDRFNSDLKVFCFILSTRSGGLGINLTGADTVVFYDSDWNPAMDAQAQDRAHRIGQTRDVHIYRMVTEHSIEENILTKAKQKRNLDFLVMDEGKFHTSAPDKVSEVDAETEEDDGLTTNKLQNILGINTESEDLLKSNSENPMSKDQLESAMAALEDEDDVRAMHSAKQEAAEALQEFDESIQEEAASEETKGKEKKDKLTKQKKNWPSNASIDSSGSDTPKAKQEDVSDDDKEMEKEFAQWQRKVGMDATTIHESLKPLERYGLHVKEQIDPYYSQYYWAEQQRLAQTTINNNEWNIEEIEQRKIEEEQKAFEDGDLLATFPEPESLPRQRQLYIREKARLRSEIMKRKLTGQNWNAKIEEHTGKTFWYNTDTGEALWEKPQVLKMLEDEEVARADGWSALPSKPLVNILEFLIPYPERTNCAATCCNWQVAASDISFVLHVWPVELGALVMDKSKLGKNHFRTISDAMQAALPGDTIELGDGHYFINDPGLIVNKQIKFVGDEHEPAHVILELSGEIIWKSSGGWMEGITIRRPRIATGVTPSNQILRIESGGCLDMFHCVFDNRGSRGNCVSVGSHAGGRWENTSIKGDSEGNNGLFVEKNAKVELTDCHIDSMDFADRSKGMVE